MGRVVRPPSDLQKEELILIRCDRRTKRLTLQMLDGESSYDLGLYRHAFTRRFKRKPDGTVEEETAAIPYLTKALGGDETARRIAYESVTSAHNFHAVLVRVADGVMTPWLKETGELSDLLTAKQIRKVEETLERNDPQASRAVALPFS